MYHLHAGSQMAPQIARVLLPYALPTFLLFIFNIWVQCGSGVMEKFRWSHLEMVQMERYNDVDRFPISGKMIQLLDPPSLGPDFIVMHLPPPLETGLA